MGQKRTSLARKGEGTFFSKKLSRRRDRGGCREVGVIASVAAKEDQVSQPYLYLDLDPDPYLDLDLCLCPFLFLDLLRDRSEVVEEAKRTDPV